MNEQVEEKILWEGNASQMVNLPFYIFCFLCFIVILVVFPILFFLPIVVAFIKWLQIKNIKYEITNERIRITKGIVSKNINELELYRVKDTTFSQPVSLRIFSLGSLIINSSDRSTPNITIHAIKNAKSLREDIRKNVEYLREKKRVREIDVG